MTDFKAWLESLNEKLLRFFTFIAGKIKNFKNLSLGEQVSYSSIGVGLLLIITALIIFIL